MKHIFIAMLALSFVNAIPVQAAYFDVSASSQSSDQGESFVTVKPYIAHVQSVTQSSDRVLSSHVAMGIQDVASSTATTTATTTNPLNDPNCNVRLSCVKHYMNRTLSRIATTTTTKLWTNSYGTTEVQETVTPSYSCAMNLNGSYSCSTIYAMSYKTVVIPNQ